MISAMGMLKYLVMLNFQVRYIAVRMPVAVSVIPGIPRMSSGFSSTISLRAIFTSCVAWIMGFFFEGLGSPL